MSKDNLVKLVHEGFQKEYKNWSYQLSTHIGFADTEDDSDDYICFREQDLLKVLECIVNKCRENRNNWYLWRAHIHCLSETVCFSKDIWENLFRNAQCLFLIDSIGDGTILIQHFSFLTVLNGIYYVVLMEENPDLDNSGSTISLDLYQLHNDDFLECITLGWQGKPRNSRVDKYLQKVAEMTSEFAATPTNLNTGSYGFDPN